MSTETIHRIAQSDTPSTVDVPNTFSGLAIWALGRFGGIVIATAFLGYAWNDSNQSHKAQTERLITILENKIRSESELANTLGRFATLIEELGKEARAAHRQP